MELQIMIVRGIVLFENITDKTKPLFNKIDKNLQKSRVAKRNKKKIK